MGLPSSPRHCQVVAAHPDRTIRLRQDIPPTAKRQIAIGQNQKVARNASENRPDSPLFPRNQVPRPSRTVVRFGAELETGAPGHTDQFGGGGGGGFDKSVVPAEPVIHQPAHRFDNGPAAGAAVVGVGGAATALGGHFSGRQAAAPALVGHEAGPGGEIGAVRVSVAVAPHVEGVFAQGLGRPFGFAIVAGEGASSGFLNVAHVRRLRLSRVCSTGLDVSTSKN